MLLVEGFSTQMGHIRQQADEISLDVARTSFTAHGA